MRLFLVGYMGCGKSTLGRRVASSLGLRFIDMDKEIELREGKSVSEIFATYGENTFREKEREVMLDLLTQEDIVVATGGGAPCFFDNMEQINQKAISIYIDTDMGVIISRLKNAKQQRPLIAGKTDTELKEFVANSLLQREPHYSKADVSVSGINIAPSDIIEAINYANNKKRL